MATTEAATDYTGSKRNSNTITHTTAWLPKIGSANQYGIEDSCATQAYLHMSASHSHRPRRRARAARAGRDGPLCSRPRKSRGDQLFLFLGQSVVERLRVFRMSRGRSTRQVLLSLLKSHLEWS